MRLLITQPGEETECFDIAGSRLASATRWVLTCTVVWAAALEEPRSVGFQLLRTPELQAFISDSCNSCTSAVHFKALRRLAEVWWHVPLCSWKTARLKNIQRKKSDCGVTVMSLIGILSLLTNDVVLRLINVTSTNISSLFLVSFWFLQYFACLSHSKLSGFTSCLCLFLTHRFDMWWTAMTSPKSQHFGRHQSGYFGDTSYHILDERVRFVWVHHTDFD